MNCGEARAREKVVPKGDGMRKENPPQTRGRGSRTESRSRTRSECAVGMETSWDDVGDGA